MAGHGEARGREDGMNVAGGMAKLAGVTGE